MTREFTAERQAKMRDKKQALAPMRKGDQSLSPGMQNALQMGFDPSGVSTADLMEAISGLRSEIQHLKSDFSADEKSKKLSAEEENAKDVRLEIAQMVRVIARAKSEIAAIKHPYAEDDRIDAASSELDAIVAATESATNQILEANENIEKEIHKIAASHHDDEEVTLMADRVAEHVISILEASNFQDITGQRVTKVVKTIRFIEDRILAMISIWGAEAFADLPVESEGGAADPESLMNGPQLENAGITQDEIDALFD
ncbi:MAG: protein phosphatase CheZ [Pseudomonadota bacterium]